MGLDQCNAELERLNLDLSGGLCQKRERLREAIFPKSSLPLSSNLSNPATSLGPSESQTEVLPNVSGNNKEQWLLLK